MDRSLMNKPINLDSLVPMVVEESSYGERAFDIFSLLLRNRIVMLGSAIDDESANLAIAQLLYLNQEDREAPISIYINSPGGMVYAGLAIYDTMQMISNPIRTVAMGVTASFGTVLLTAGSKGHRYALPNATIHMHQPEGGAEGQVSDIEIQAREFLRLRRNLNQILSHHTGQPLEVIERDTSRDFWLDAKAAMEYGIIDKVL